MSNTQYMSRSQSEDKPALAAEVPLCVDLDGTLILSDVLWESIIQLWSKPAAAIRAAWALLHGKAALKGVLANEVAIDPASLPYREDLLAFLRTEKEAGRQLILVTATHRMIAERVAEHLGIFSGVMATEEKLNLGGEHKKEALVAAYGVGGFDYIGDHLKDMAIFSVARHSFLADPSDRLRKMADKVGNVGRVFSRSRSWSKVILRTMRVHQYAKNALLGVPLLTAHLVLDAGAWLNLILAFFSFSMLASATYIVNDLHDLSLDRKHQKKRFRPLASGDISIPAGIGLAFILICASFALTLAFLPRLFFVFLLIYTVLTLAYSFDLKRRLIVDALALAMLYTLRIIAGAAAISVVLSEWLLMFSLFFFVSLALLKRAIELEGITDGKRIPGRGYVPSDADIIRSIGPSSGLLAVLVFALYINSPGVTKLYSTPQMLWLLCPLLIYWITRIWFLANRGQVNHDPVVFALMDIRSYIVAAFAGIILMLASFDLSKNIL
ncbi:MAG: UbiA family prenyltransferase [Gammaproteobacteria bacterium]|nr:UbiA family prenyltransferase [Gammaproteobacteria bacterium]